MGGLLLDILAFCKAVTLRSGADIEIVTREGVAMRLVWVATDHQCSGTQSWLCLLLATDFETGV